MNRFFRTAYSTTFVYIFITLIIVSFTGVSFSLGSFACLYFSLLVALLPAASVRFSGKDALMAVIGVLIALLGFIPIALTEGTGLAHYIGYGIGIVAAVVCFIVLRNRTRHDDFQAKFTFSLIVGVCLIIFFTAAGVADGGFFGLNRDFVLIALVDLIPIVIVLLATGILLLRGLRAEESVVDRKAFYRRQLRDALIFALIVAILAVVNPFGFLSRQSGFFTVKILNPFFNFISGTVQKALNWIAPPTEPKMDTVPTPGPAPTPPPDSTPVPTAVPGEEEAAPTPYVDPEEVELRNEAFARTVTYIFLGALALVLLIILIRQLLKLIKKLKKNASLGSTGYPNEIREALPEDETAEEEKPSRRSSDPRERMRWLYGDFLKHLRRLRLPPKPSDTCGQIADRASHELRRHKEELDEFTGLYERARYRFREEPTQAEASRMKTLLGILRKRDRD